MKIRLLLVLLLFIVAQPAHAITSLNAAPEIESATFRALWSGSCWRKMWLFNYDVCAPVIMNELVAEGLDKVDGKVFFPFDSAELTPESKTTLDTLAQKFSSAINVQDAVIVGYTDRIGSSSYNRALSERRAKAVQDYLAKYGYLNTRLVKLSGHGEMKPVTKCNLQASRQQQILCMAQDRRAELDIQYFSKNASLSAY